MTLQPAATSLDSLLEWEAENTEDNTILQRLKTLALAHLPDGWRDWKVHTFTKDELLGAELDPQILNKLRFALPTVGIARAFSPKCSSLPEKVYRDIRVRMLDWPFCRGLIIAPSSLSARIRGSAVQNELVLAALADLRPLLKSRLEASKEITEELKEQEDDASSVNTSSSIAKKSSRLDKLERGHEELKAMLESFISRFNSRDQEEAEEFPESFSEGEEEELSEKEDHQISLPPSQRPISPVSPVSEWIAPDTPMEEDFDFYPKTREQEPTVPTPKPHIAAQGIECQRLGKTTYNQIRYTDVQKKLHASPVFSALKVNLPFAKNSSGQLQDQLARTDSTLGTIIHGLLLQRDALSNAIRELSSKHPLLKEDLKNAFSKESPLRLVSDDLLQYACGRRAEVIEQRRNSLLPKDEYQTALLNAIPPSSTHLFCEKQLNELMRQPMQQQFFRVSTGRLRHLKQYGSRPSLTQGGVSQSSRVISKQRRSYSARSTENWKRQSGGGNRVKRAQTYRGNKAPKPSSSRSVQKP